MLKLKEKLKFIVVICAMLAFVAQPLAAVSVSCSMMSAQLSDTESGVMTDMTHSNSMMHSSSMTHSSNMNHAINTMPDTSDEGSVTVNECCTDGTCVMTNCLYSPSAFVGANPKFEISFSNTPSVVYRDAYQTLAFSSLFRPPIYR